MKGSIVTRDRKDRNGNIIGKRYYVTYYFEGKKRWVTAGTTKKEADAIRAKIVSEIYEGDYKIIKDMPFDQFALKWLQEKEVSVRYSTWRAYRSHIKVILIPYFGARSLKKITYSQCKKFKIDIAEGKQSNATVNKYLKTLRAILDEAVREGHIKQNPAHYVETLKVEKKQHEILTAIETERLIGAVDSHYRTLFLTAVLTGMRLGEILGLTWENIDFKNASIRVEKSLYERKLGEPKSESSKRDVAIPRLLVDFLRGEQIRALQKGHHLPEHLVFVNSEGGPIDGPALNKYVFKRALDKAGIVKQTRIHDLRHAYASRMLADGVDVAYIAEQLGHASPQITLSIYAHAIKKNQHEAVEKMAMSLFGART